MSFLQKLAHDSDDEEQTRQVEREHRAIVPKKQFSKSLASKGRREYEVLKRDARKRELQILARNYVFQLAQKLQTRISDSAFRGDGDDVELFKQCIVALCGEEEGAEKSSGKSVVDGEVQRELLGDLTQYGTFLKELLQQRMAGTRRSKKQEEEEEDLSVSAAAAVEMSDTVDMEYFTVEGMMISPSSSGLERENLVKRMRVAPSAENLNLLQEESIDSGMHPLDILEEMQRLCLSRHSDEVFVEYAHMLETNLNIFFANDDWNSSAVRLDRALRLIETFLSVYRMRYSHLGDEIYTYVAHVFASYLRALEGYFRLKDSRVAARHNRRLKKRMESRKSVKDRNKDLAPLVRERPSKETIRAQLDQLFDGSERHWSFEMDSLCKWLRTLDLSALVEASQKSNDDEEGEASDDSDDDSDEDSSDSDDSDSDDDESDSDDSSDSDEEDAQDHLAEQARYTTELFSHLCYTVLARAHKQLTFDSIVDYLRFLLLSEEYNSRFASSGGYFDNSSTAKMPLELTKDATIGLRAERIASALTRNRALLMRTLEKYEAQEEEPREQSHQGWSESQSESDFTPSDDSDHDDSAMSDSSSD